jgi:PAS domain-containing protein
MNIPAWTKEFPASIVVCDRDGIILTLNDRAIESFREEGGERLLGQNLLDCHPEPARTKTRDLLQSGSKNVYTIEKNGVRKLIYQSPWYQDGAYAGLVELSLVIPDEMPHFVRGKQVE